MGVQWVQLYCNMVGWKLYCNLRLLGSKCIATLGCWVQSVLQEGAVARIVLQHNRLYCNGCAVARIVLQHNKVYCKRVQWLELYCNTTDCIVVGVQWLGLYCNTTNCIAILVLYCDLKGCFFFFFFLYTWCIVAKKGHGAENCIAIQLLYCNLGRE